MADNITVDTITGSPIVSTDQVGTDHFQLVKIALGALNANDGPVATGNPLPVTGNITSVSNVATIGTSVTPGVAATNLGKAVDAVAGGTDTGVAVLAKRVTTPAAITPANGDYSVLQLDDNGNLRVNITAGGSQAQIDDSAFTPGSSEVVAFAAVADETATDSVDEGDMGAVRMTADRKLITSSYAHAAGGATPYQLISAASTNATSVKGSAGTVYSVVCMNTNAAARYLKLYDKATAPTVGTDTPVQTYLIPGGSLGFVVALGVPGLAFANGIAFALTTGMAVSDTGAVAATEIAVNLGYK